MQDISKTMLHTIKRKTLFNFMPYSSLLLLLLVLCYYYSCSQAPNLASQTPNNALNVNNCGVTISAKLYTHRDRAYIKQHHYTSTHLRQFTGCTFRCYGHGCGALGGCSFDSGHLCLACLLSALKKVAIQGYRMENLRVNDGYPRELGHLA
jgi:hypothetical protein